MGQKVNKAKLRQLIKILILLLGIGLLLFSAQDIYRCLVRASRINEKWVQLYLPRLNVNLIKQAAEILK